MPPLKFAILIMFLPAAVLAQTYTTSDFPISFDPSAPGLVSASNLLPKPATAITIKDGHFFANNKRVRFWGVNIAYGGNFPTHEQADKLANRLANFGINAVRFHHMDSSTFPSGIFADQSLTKFSDEALDRLDYFIAALKKQGVYSNLNLHVSRQYAKPHKWENADKLENYDKIVDIFHSELIEANKQYARDLLIHVNKYTGNRLADEPAVCMVEINNEDTIFFWGGVQKLANLPEPYSGILKKQWNQWLTTQYSSREKLLASWGEKSLANDEDPIKGSVARGILKGQNASHPRSMDWYRFLQFTDEKHFTSMRDYLKKDLGVKSPITGTIALGPLGALSQSKMDFVDAHAYWDHPHFPRRQWDMKDWEIKNTAMSEAPASSALWGLAASRVAGKPFTVTEYNHAAPNEYQAECIPMIASFAALQDWDAVFLFAYTHNNKYEKPKMESFFDIEGNPLKMPFMPMGARIFLGQLMRPMQRATLLKPTMVEMLQSGPATHSDIWSFVQRDRIIPRMITRDDLLNSRFAIAFDAAATLPQSPPGPVAYYLEEFYTVNDERAIVYSGKASLVEGKTFPLALTNITNPFISLILVSEDGKPLRESQKLLLGLVGRGGNKNMSWNEKRNSISDQWGSAPPQIEVIKGHLKLNSTTPLRVYPLDNTGQRIPQAGNNSASDFELGNSPALWYQITRWDRKDQK